MNQRAQVDGHDQVRPRGVGEDKARIFSRDARRDEVAVEAERTLGCLLESGTDRLISLGNRTREHRGRLLEGHIALRLLVEGDTGAMAHELVAERSGDAGDGEGEDDVLNGAAVA